jgi:hypothetical protein
LSQTSNKLDLRSYHREELREVVENMANTAIEQGYPFLAAGHHLALNDADSAVMKLLRANELVFAYVAALLYKLPIVGQIGFLLALRAERYGERNIGHSILKTIGDNRKMALYIASCQTDNKVIDELYSQNGLSSRDKFAQSADSYLQNGEIPKAVLNFVLARQTEKAASVAVQYATGKIIEFWLKYFRCFQKPEI